MAPPEPRFRYHNEREKSSRSFVLFAFFVEVYPRRPDIKKPWRVRWKGNSQGPVCNERSEVKMGGIALQSRYAKGLDVRTRDGVLRREEQTKSERDVELNDLFCLTS